MIKIIVSWWRRDRLGGGRNTKEYKGKTGGKRGCLSDYTTLVDRITVSWWGGRAGYEVKRNAKEHK